MIKSAVEREIQDPVKWEKLVPPETPEQPLILVEKNSEQEGFDAVFALELTGIGREPKKRADAKKEDSERETGKERYKKLLLAGLAGNQALDFVYTGGKDKNGKAYFNWKLMGHAQGLSADEAASSARRLWQNLNVITGTLRKDYTFSPVKEESGLRKEREQVGWKAELKRVGVAIKAESSMPMGFLRHQQTSGSGSTVILAPEKGLSISKSFDSLALGASGCGSEVKLILSIRPVALSDEEIRTMAFALKWLRNGESKQISFHDAIREGSDNKEAISSIESGLEAWIANPAGYRVSCTVLSDEPIPLALLRLVGSDIMAGPFTIERGNPEDISKLKDCLDSRWSLPQHDLRKGENDGFVVDLQDCINDIALLPPLFPRVDTLRACNVKRSFEHVAGSMPQTGIVLGKVGSGSASTRICFSRNDRSRHSYIIGSTGTGKSTLLFNMIRQDIENGEGVCLIDPHGDLFNQVLRSVPTERAEDVVIVDPSDFERTVGINFLETSGDFNKSVQMNFITNEMMKIFDRLYDMKLTGGPIFEQYVRNAMLLLMENEYPHATLTDIPLLFEDQEFRRFLKRGCKNPLVESFWTKQAEEAGGDAALRNVVPYITSKLNQFTHNALLRPIIGQPQSTINFREIMDSRKILLVNLSKGLLGELDAQLLGMLLIGKLFSSAMGRVSLRPEKRKPFYLYVDEFQNFATESVAFLLSEARKFGISLALANQNLGQLREGSGHKNILDAVLGNVGSMFMLRLGVIDSEVMSLYMKPDLDSQDLQNLPDFNVAARILTNNTPSKPFVFKTLPAPDEGNDSLASKIRTLSRLKYATNVEFVEAEIVRRRTAYRKGNKGRNED